LSSGYPREFLQAIEPPNKVLHPSASVKQSYAPHAGVPGKEGRDP